MRDGQPCTIRITRSFKADAAIFYELRITHQGQTYLSSLRYSALRKLSPFLPNSLLKFPQPQHLSSLFSQVTGNAEFFATRLEELSAYFEDISKITDLENSLGMTLLLHGAVRIDGGCEGMAVTPATPRICGRKLVARVVEE